MAVGVDGVLQQIDAVLREARKVREHQVAVPRVARRFSEDETPQRYYSEKSDEDITRANMLILSALKKFSPPQSPYMDQAEAVMKQVSASNDWGREQLIGMLKALRFEYANGAMDTVEELIHADLFADFLAMSRHLLDKSFKDPAAVLAAGVLEQHLRALAVRHRVPTRKASGEPRRSETLNEELSKCGAYPLSTQKEVTAKLELRNAAAHGEWSKYDHKQVAMFIEWVGFFLQKHPA